MAMADMGGAVRMAALGIGFRVGWNGHDAVRSMRFCVGSRCELRTLPKVTVLLRANRFWSRSQCCTMCQIPRLSPPCATCKQYLHGCT